MMVPSRLITLPRLALRRLRTDKLWDAQGDLKKATDRRMLAGANKVVTTAAAAMREVMHLLQPLVQGVEPVLEPSAALPAAGG